MTQNEKDLLLRDLCSRLPYGVIVKDRNGVHELTAGNTEFTDLLYNGKCNIKPYLFPLSSMTEEQKNECFKGIPLEIDKYGNVAVKEDLHGGNQYTDLEIYLEVINWFHKNHIDYRGLIPMDLATDATELNIY